VLNDDESVLCLITMLLEEDNTTVGAVAKGK